MHTHAHSQAHPLYMITKLAELNNVISPNDQRHFKVQNSNKQVILISQ